MLGSFGAAWWGLGWPAEAVQEVAELHAQCVEAAERHGKTNLRRLSSSEFKQGRRDRRSGVARLRGASRGEVWVQEKPGKGEWHSRGGAGGRWAGTHGGGDRRRWSRAPVELEVGERWEGPV